MKTFNIIKKITLCTFVILLVSLLSFKVNAYDYATTNAITVSGASIRTTGNQGLRFTCKCEYIPLDEKTIATYGAYVAFGSKNENGNALTSSEIFNAAACNEKINSHSVLNAYVTECDSNGYYYVTMTDIPSGYYLQDITIAPYVILSDASMVISSDALTRNIGEIALAYLNDGGTESTLITTVKNELNNSYRKQHQDSLNNLYINSVVYETEPKYIFKEFIKDWNKYTGASLDYSTLTFTDFINALKTSDSITEQEIQASNLYKFLRAYKTKYLYILNLIQSLTELNSDLSDQIYYIEDGGPIGEEPTFWNSGIDLLAYIYGLLNQVDTSSNSGYNFVSGSTSIYQALATNNNSIYTNLLDDDRELTIQKITDKFKLPALSEASKWVSYEYGSSEIINNKYYPSSNFTCQSGYNYFFNSETPIQCNMKLLVDNDLDGKDLNINNSCVSIDGNGNSMSNGTIVLGKKVEKIDFYNVDFDDVKIEREASDNTDQGCSICNITFENCDFSNDLGCLSITEADNTYNANIQFINCTFTGTGYGVYISNNRGVTFKDCTFTGFCCQAIEIDKSTNGSGETGCIEIDNCDFISCGEFIIYVKYLDNRNGAKLKMHDCAFSETTYTSVGLYVDDASDYDLNSISLTDNSIDFGTLAQANHTVVCMYNSSKHMIDSTGIVTYNPE